MRAPHVVLLAFVLTSSSLAQLPPTPDAQRYPQLNAMKTWLESNAAQSRHCALSGGLFAEASDIYRQNRSEAGTLDAMIKRHAEKLGASDREKLRNTLTHVTGMAAGLAGLSAESAPIAYSQLCIGRAQQPKTELSPGAIQTRFDAALRCEGAHAAGSLDRKECVAAAFKL
jgi:hypothetical protein